MRTVLTDVEFGGIDQDVLVFSPLDLLVSGTAVNMARAATRLFADCQVLASVGHDPFTDTVARVVEEIPASWNLVVKEGVNNGLVMVIRDSASGRPGGHRLLVSGAPAPSHSLSSEDVLAARNLIERSNLLFFDGYSLLSKTSRGAVSQAADLARAAGALVCLDVVPHLISHHVPPFDVQEALSLADVVITEARTLAALHEVAYTYPLARPDVDGLITRLGDLGMLERTWLIRYGAGDMQDVVVVVPGHQHVYYKTDYMSAHERAGFGDRVAAFELFRLLQWRADGMALSRYDGGRCLDGDPRGPRSC